MGRPQKASGKRSPEERIQELREAVTSADATGLVAGEELITKAETELPSEAPERKTKRLPHIP